MEPPPVETLLASTHFVPRILDASDGLQWERCYCGSGIVRPSASNRCRSPFAYLTFMPEFLANYFSTRTGRKQQLTYLWRASWALKHFLPLKKSCLCVIAAWWGYSATFYQRGLPISAPCFTSTTPDGGRLYLVPSESVVFLELVMEQWPCL